MRKYILFLVLILASCTPQRQLARFLARHPELKRDSIIVIHDTMEDTNDNDNIENRYDESVQFDDNGKPVVS